MDRRSWLWRRKTSEKSPGETESTESVSSHSERFSDDQVYPTHSSQSPEIPSKTAPNDENVNDSVKILTEKLSAALLDICSKEELVKQHGKVAEEAVSGWEKAEKEVLALRQQLEAATMKNSTLEDRVGHLDGALKECVRQLRQAREEQEHKIHEAVSKKVSEWESTKLHPQSQLAELQLQHQTAKSSPSVDCNLHTKLEKVEKENAALRREIFAQAEAVEMSILERDLSTQAAEAASKQHLESIKKAAKLEAECRRLKAIARKALPSYDIKSATVSFTNRESGTDSQSDNVEFDDGMMRGLDVSETMTSSSDSLASSLTTEHDQLKIQKATRRNVVVPLSDINLLDDFLEMERFAASPDTHTSSFPKGLPLSNQASSVERKMKSELEVMTQKIRELEQKLETREAEKEELVEALIECQEQLQTSHCQLEEAAVKWIEFETQLALANESRETVEKEVKATKTERQVTESQLRAAEAEIRTCLSNIDSLQKEAEKERAFSAENVKICKKLEAELQMSNRRLNDAEANLLELQSQLVHMKNAKHSAEKEVKAVHARSEQLKDAETEIEALLTKIGSLDYEVEKERAFSVRTIEKCQRLEGELGTSQNCLKELENKLAEIEYQLTLANEMSKVLKKDADTANAANKMLESQLATSQSRISELENKLAELEYQLTLSNELNESFKKEAEDAIAPCKSLESQLRNAEAETHTFPSKVYALEKVVEKERALSAEYITKCHKLDDELSTFDHEPELRQYPELQCAASTKFDLNVRQENDLAEAAYKFTECQKTIASLGQQLKSLASLDDLLGDYDEPETLTITISSNRA